ncbi:hypothetical protein CVV67_17855 [Arthrobacter stackebrandtii]|nr:hypothetical protein CVV67_17855 [Arthrobacter stackebrandtii]
MDAGEDDGQWSEDDWLEKFRVDAAKLPGLPLAMFGLDPRDSPADPADPAQPQRHAVLLAGAVHWAYENLIDELFDDIALLRQDPSALGETLQLAQLPEQHRDSVDPLFAQRFLAAALDLGTALATDYTGPSCPAQAQALMLILGGVDLVPRLLPSIPLPHGWRDALALDAAQADNHDVSDWFIPFPGHTLNPYAADAE